MKENLERYSMKQRLMKVILAENGNECLEKSSRKTEEYLSSRYSAYWNETDKSILKNCNKITLQAIIQGQINQSTTIYSDKWRRYDGLVAVGYDRHFKVNHGDNEFSKCNGIHINGIENFWSFSKRRLSKFNGMKKNFELHLKECEWRYGKSLCYNEN